MKYNITQNLRLKAALVAYLKASSAPRATGDIGQFHRLPL